MLIKSLKHIAFIKYGGLASGGTEVSFQTVAKHLSKDYIVDYYYCDPSPYIGSDFVHPPSEKSREEYLKNIKKGEDIGNGTYARSFKSLSKSNLTINIPRTRNGDFKPITIELG